MSTCRLCQNSFEIVDEDRKFYAKIAVPEPKLCPDCRAQRILAFRNERKLYKRTCDFSKKNILSCYSPDKPFKVYENEIWWSDKWDPLDYGRDFDFNRPFFEQFRELQIAVPRLALSNTNNENSDYTNMCGYNKNCYLIFASEYDEECLYGLQIINSKHCIDVMNCYESEYCYEVVDCEKCYQLFFSKNCRGCTESMFLIDCRGCSNCLFSTNLRNQHYYIFNKAYSKEEYEIRKQGIFKQLQNGKIGQLLQQFSDIEKKMIHRHLIMANCENSYGNYLSDCKNARHCFDLTKGQDCKYVSTGYNVKDLMDVYHTTEAELGYFSTSLGYNSYCALFSFGSWSSSYLQYIDNVHYCSHMFGCVGVKRKQYCILNKQYSKEDYEKLVPKIIEHMKKTGEYGEFFPMQISPFAYNETKAFEYFPLMKEEALAKNFQWRDEDRHDYPPQTYQIPLDIAKVSDEITAEILACQAKISNSTAKDVHSTTGVCGRNYRIVAPELAFYRKMNLPIPTECPDCRHRKRMNWRNPRRLWTRTCAKCASPIQTTYATDRAEIVYCEKCYLETVY